MLSAEFIGNCIEEMMKKDVTITLQSSKVFDQSYSYFSTDKKDKADFQNPVFFLNYETHDNQNNLEVFLHEYCHFLQWKNKRQIYEDSYSAYKRYNSWLSYKRNKISKDDIRTIQKLEIDCDKLAVQVIKKKKLPINTERYIKYSNCYVLMYNFSYKHRSFFNEKRVLDSKILDCVPNKFLTILQIKKGIPRYKELFFDYYEKV